MHKERSFFRTLWAAFGGEQKQPHGTTIKRKASEEDTSKCLPSCSASLAPHCTGLPFPCLCNPLLLPPFNSSHVMRLGHWWLRPRFGPTVSYSPIQSFNFYHAPKINKFKCFKLEAVRRPPVYHESLHFISCSSTEFKILGVTFQRDT